MDCKQCASSEDMAVDWSQLAQSNGLSNQAGASL